MEEERTKISFDVEKLTNFLDGGPQLTARRRQIISAAEQVPAFKSELFHIRTRTENFVTGLQLTKELQRLKKELNLKNDEWHILRSSLSFSIGTDLHEVAFLPYLKNQADEEQYKKWVPLAQNYAIIGAYAQTELGHGSNVREIETTSEFKEESDEFELNSPTLSSTKWWIGGLGRTATHAIVMAQLIIKHKNYGVHPFLVQVRSLENHKLLPGITCGDIGPKIGFQSVDNGFLRFSRVRIPRNQMLMRHFKVDRQGTYTKPSHDKIAYTGMTSIRSGITLSVYHMLARATTIAVRYSIVRQQFRTNLSKNPKAKMAHETPILDYRMQQHRIFPALAACYAFYFAGRYSQKIFSQMEKEIANGDLSSLSEVHATSSGLKSLSTKLGAELVEECRFSCGGHGYSSFSGIPLVYSELVALTTAEGETYVLTQQTTRYLLKALQASLQNKSLARGVSYLKDVSSRLPERISSSFTQFRDSLFQLQAYSHRAIYLLSSLAQSIQTSIENGQTAAQAWNDHLVEVARVSNAHCMYIFMEGFVNMIGQIQQQSPDLYPPLKRLCDLFALWNMERTLADFMEDGFLNGHHSLLIKKEIRNLLDEIRPDALGLVDAFDFSDNQLNSALGRYDGKCYETLYEWAQREYLNQTEVVQGYEEHLKPLIQQKLFSSKL